MASPAETLVPFDQVIRAARLERGLTQEQAAHEVGVTLGTWQNWESGKHEPRLPELRRVCMAYGWRLPFLESDTPGNRIRVPLLPHPVGQAA